MTLIQAALLAAMLFPAGAAIADADGANAAVARGQENGKGVEARTLRVSNLR